MHPPAQTAVRFARPVGTRRSRWRGWLGARAALVGLVGLVGLVATSVALLGGCRRDQASIGGAETPFVFLLSPDHGDAATAKELGELLSQASGMTVQVRRASSTAAAVAEAGSPQIDAGIMSLFPYLLARREFGVTAGLQPLRGEAGAGYGGALWVRADGPIASLGGLEGRTVAFVDRTSTTGYLLAAQVIEQQRLHVLPLFAGSHEAALAAVRAGRADAVATFVHPLPADMRELARTGQVPNEPVFFRRDLPADKRQALVAALGKLGDSERGRAVLGRLAGITGFLPIDDAAYVEVGAFLEAARHRLEDLVPGGWQIVNANQRPLSDLGAF